jgi:hypothetical protein
MKSPSRATTWAAAAVVFVILPLLVTLSTLGANVALEATGAQSSIFGAMGAPEAMLAGWSVVAIAVVGGLIGTLLREQLPQH